MGTTPTLALPYPELSDTADVPRDVKALAEAIDAALATRTLPAGVIQMWPGNSAPTGWFLCNGTPVPAAENPSLAAIFGQTGGNVILPDLRGRVLVGAGALPGSSPAASAALRQPGGAASVALSTAQMPSHNHTGEIKITGGGDNGNPGPPIYGVGVDWGLPIYIRYDAATRAYNLNTVIVDPNGGNEAHDNMPPHYAVNYVIKAG